MKTYFVFLEAGGAVRIEAEDFDAAVSEAHSRFPCDEIENIDCVEDNAAADDAL